MRIPAFTSHQAARRADQARVAWLVELVFAAFILLAMLAAWCA